MTIQILSSDSNTMAEFVLMIWVGFLFMAFKNLAEAKKIWYLYGKPVCLKEKKKEAAKIEEVVLERERNIGGFWARNDLLWIVICLFFNLLCSDYCSRAREEVKKSN